MDEKQAITFKDWDGLKGKIGRYVALLLPLKSRIDVPGALHHIIARGIERLPRMISFKLFTVGGWMSLLKTVAEGVIGSGPAALHSQKFSK